MADVRITKYGFEWGPARVTRLFDEDRTGVYLEISGAREVVQVRVTKGGRLRIGPVKKRSGV